MFRTACANWPDGGWYAACRYAATDGEPERTYHNAYVMEFAPDGRCRAFHEFYMLQDGA